MNGIGNGLFNPEGNITRQEAAVMLKNMAENVFAADIGALPAGFSDTAQIAAWVQSSVDFVFANKIMSGVGSNTFAPLSPYTREQSIVTVPDLLYSYELGDVSANLKEKTEILTTMVFKMLRALIEEF